MEDCTLSQIRKPNWILRLFNCFHQTSRTIKPWQRCRQWQRSWWGCHRHPHRWLIGTPRLQASGGLNLNSLPLVNRNRYEHEQLLCTVYSLFCQCTLSLHGQYRECRQNTENIVRLKIRWIFFLEPGKFIHCKCWESEVGGGQEVTESPKGGSAKTPHHHPSPLPPPHCPPPPPDRSPQKPPFS